MSAATPRLPDYLQHIIEAIERIQRYTEEMDELGFAQNQMVQDAVIRNFEIIVEASRNIERSNPGFVAAHPELPLSLACEMRNVLAHGYFNVDLGVVWKIVDQDLSGLLQQIRAVAANLNE